MPIYAQLYDYTTCTPAHCPPLHTYRHPGRWPPPEPKPVLHRPTNQYVQLPETTRASAQYVNRGERGRKEDRSASRDPDPRRVRFADRPIVIELPNYPPHNISAPPAPSRVAPRSRSSSRYPPEARPRPPAPAPSAIRPPPPAPPLNTRPTTATSRTPSTSAPAYSRYHRPPTNSSLHDLLTSFPSGLWDMRRNARPTYHRHYEPHYSEPVFPHNPTKRSIKLYFIPCGRMEFSWIAKVKADCRNRLTVNDVLDTISTELFRRSACRDLYEGHPCYSKVRSAHRMRTRCGYTKKPHYDDAFRNIDLYHVDRGQVLYFKGLRPETLRDGEVVYLVKFSYA